jgi:hypothetical protein
MQKLALEAPEEEMRMLNRKMIIDRRDGDIKDRGIM